MDNKLMIYAISDSIGETARNMIKAAMSQFYGRDPYEIKRFPFVTEKEMLLDILENAKKDNAIVVYTLVEDEMCDVIREFSEREGISSIDLMSDMLKKISSRLEKKPKREPGIIRKLDESYFKRIDAIEFAVKYDDGKDPRGVLKADLVLVGISRTSKTPLSMYLANKHIKVSNVPLVPEVQIPKELSEVSTKKIIGLTNSPEKLNEIRTERLKALGLSSKANYANFERILDELDYSENVFKRLGCPVINVANKAIEETAGIILDIMKENGLNIFKDGEI